MSKRTVGLGLIALGVVIALVSLASDLIGVGDMSGIGWKQLLGTAIGFIVALVGIWLALRKPKQVQ